jgi:hypothetical protein
MDKQKPKVIKRDEPKRIRPVVIRQILIDERRKLLQRVSQIDRQLQTT